MMTLDKFFAEAKRLKLRIIPDDPSETRDALDAKDAEIERLRAALEWIAENGPDDAYDLRDKAREALGQ